MRSRKKKRENGKHTKQSHGKGKRTFGKGGGPLARLTPSANPPKIFGTQESEREWGERKENSWGEKGKKKGGDDKKKGNENPQCGIHFLGN